jgi:hypothetical protein
MKTFEIEVRAKFHVQGENYLAAVKELLSHVDFSEAFSTANAVFRELSSPFIAQDPAQWPAPISEELLAEEEKAFFAAVDAARAKYIPGALDASVVVDVAKMIRESVFADPVIDVSDLHKPDSGKEEPK